MTLECIQETVQAIEDTKGQPFDPSEICHLLIENIMAVLVRNVYYLPPKKVCANTLTP